MNVTISFQDLKLEIKIRLRGSFAGVNFWLFILRFLFFGWLFDLNECLERLSKRALCTAGKIFHMFNFYTVITSKTMVNSEIPPSIN